MGNRHWYHVTYEDWGPSVLLSPRLPSRPAEGEPLTPRTCVSPTIAQCCFAKPHTARSLSVYRAVGDAQLTAAIDVDDATISEEHWYLAPTTFELVKAIGSPFRDYWAETGGDRLDLVEPMRRIAELRRILGE